MQVYYAQNGQLSFQEWKEISVQLQKGAIAVLPTDSVYTVACSLESKSGIEKLCALVGKKPSQANLSIICSDFEMIAHYCTPIPNSIFRLMKSNFPGPFTFILNADVRKTRHWENKRKTLGIRMPGEPLLLKIIQEINAPLICSSLHHDQTDEYWSDPEEIARNYEQRIDILVNDGVGGNLPSTVVDATGEEAVLLREGKGVL